MSVGSLIESWRDFREQSRNRMCRLPSKSFVLLKSQRGSAAVDYAVIIVFTVLAVIAVIASLQDSGDAIFQATATVVGDFGKIPEG